VTRATKINRNFYRNLREIGRSHYDVMRIIQPERKDQFLKDVTPIIRQLEPKQVPKISWWEKILNRI
jgi:hypothetical protein